MAPLVSVVVPVRDGMPYLADAIESALAQDYPDLEVVVAETGSTDGSRAWLEARRDSRLRIVDGRPGAGPNWTAATEAARGAFVKLLCQDDLLAPDAVTRQVADLERFPDAVMAVAQRDIIDARSRLVSRSRGLQGLRGEALPVAALIRRTYEHGTNVIGEPLTVLFRAEAARQALPWDDSLPLMLDVSGYARVAAHGGMAVIRYESVGAFRVSTGSWSTRLAGVQLRQFTAWQAAYEQAHPGIPERDRRLAHRAARQRALERRAAYAVLRLRGGLRARR